MRRTSNLFASALVLLASSCKKDEPPQEAPQPTPDPEVASLRVAEGDPPVDGPVPPATSMVFFGIEGSLYPLACFDAEKKALLAGDPCLAMVPPGAEVRVASEDAEYNKVAGERTEPHCMIGSGKNLAVAVDGITAGASFFYGVWPRAAMKLIKPIDRDSTSPRATQLGSDEVAKLSAAVKAKGGSVGDELRAHQVAELDLDGQGKPDKVYSVFVPDPVISEQYRWSGLFFAPEGNLDALVFVAQSKSKRDVFEVRGTLDLDGDGQRELWMRMVFEEGAGDRIVTFQDGKPKAIGDWSCGAGV